MFLQFIIHQISLFFLVQQKQVEIERVPKWLKMLKNWSKYRNSDRVSFTSRGCDHFFENQREQCDVAPWRSKLMLNWLMHARTHARTHANTHTHTHTHTHLHLLLVSLCRWLRGCIKAFHYSWEDRPGPCFWMLRKSRATMQENMRYNIKIWMHKHSHTVTQQIKLWPVDTM